MFFLACCDTNVVTNECKRSVMQIPFSILWLVLLTTILLIPTVVPNIANPVA